MEAMNKSILLEYILLLNLIHTIKHIKEIIEITAINPFIIIIV